jgi:hypothetical protein
MSELITAAGNLLTGSSISWRGNSTFASGSLGRQHAPHGSLDIGAGQAAFSLCRPQHAGRPLSRAVGECQSLTAQDAQHRPWMFPLAETATVAARARTRVERSAETPISEVYVADRSLVQDRGETQRWWRPSPQRKPPPRVSDNSTRLPPTSSTAAAWRCTSTDLSRKRPGSRRSRSKPSGPCNRPIVPGRSPCR